MEHVAYLAQQLLNAVQIALVYAPIALGTVLFHGLTRRFNLAFGALSTWASYLAVAIFAGDLARRGVPPAALFGLAVLAGVVVGALYGGLVAASVRPLLAVPPLAILVATLGWTIALEEGARLAAGSRELWLAPLFGDPLLSVPLGGSVLRLTLLQAVLWSLAAAAILAVPLVMRLTAYGRRWRAVSQDPVMARLLGVDVERLYLATALLASGLAGLSGALTGLAYGHAGFHGAFLVALKALFAAILGGLHSPGGAVLAAAALALGESLWSAYFPGDYRDVAVFVVLALLVVLRPAGLAGGPPATRV